MEIFQQLQQRVKQDFQAFRRLGKEGRLDVLFNYGLDTSEIQYYMKLDDAGIDKMANNIELASTNINYIKMLLNSQERTMQAALDGASRDVIETIRANCMSQLES